MYLFVCIDITMIITKPTLSFNEIVYTCHGHITEIHQRCNSLHPAVRRPWTMGGGMQ